MKEKEGDREICESAPGRVQQYVFTHTSRPTSFPRKPEYERRRMDEAVTTGLKKIGQFSFTES